MRVYLVEKNLPNGRYWIQLGRDDFQFDPRGETVLVEFEDESRSRCYIAALTGGHGAVVVPF